MKASTELAALAWLSAGALSLQAPAEENPSYEASTISFEGEAGGYRFEDTSGDSLLDLIVAQWSRERRREIVIHFQRPGGAYPLEPDRRLQVKKDTVAFSLADVREEPGAEIIFFTASSAFSFCTEKSDYAGNVQKLFQERFLWDVPGPRDIAFLPGAGDLQLDGSPEILVPTREGFALFGASPETSLQRSEGRGPEPATRRVAGPAEYGRRASFPAPANARRQGEKRERRSIRIGASEAQIGRKSSALVLDEAESRQGGGNLLQTERWLPAPQLADANGDGLRDLVCLERPEGEKTLVLFLQGPGGSFPREPSWRGKFSGKGPLRPLDLDEDRQVDLLGKEQETSGGATLSFHRNRGGSFDLEHPDQVLKFSGYAAGETVADLDGDGKKELAVSTYEISGMPGITGGSVERRLFIHRSEPGGLFARRPSSTFEEKFGPDAIRGIGQQAVLDGDLLGRGARDVLLVQRDGALEARKIDENLRIAEEAFFRFVPPKVIVEVRVHDLNGDHRADLVLSHSSSRTILVSRK